MSGALTRRTGNGCQGTGKRTLLICWSSMDRTCTAFAIVPSERTSSMRSFCSPAVSCAVSCAQQKTLSSESNAWRRHGSHPSDARIPRCVGARPATSVRPGADRRDRAHLAAEGREIDVRGASRPRLIETHIHLDKSCILDRCKAEKAISKRRSRGGQGQDSLHA